MKILSFDIEEWFHFDICSTEDKWINYSPRINLFLPQILDVLEAKNIKATFFCLGWIARTYPDIIRRIHEKGHEIGCHTDKHLFIHEMKPIDFDTDLKKALFSLENIIGEKIKSFRAPSFTITEESKWAFEILAKNGIENDCSIFPTSRSYGGFPSYDATTPAFIEYDGIKIKEFPISTGKIMGKRIVYTGGGYFRLFPYWFIKTMLSQSDYAMSYFHMRDFDYEQPRFSYLTLERKFKSYFGLKSSYSKFMKLLDDFEWINVQSASDKIDWDEVKTIRL